MIGLGVVDIAIGLSLVYLLLSSIVSAIRERCEAVMKTRAVDLERGISELLQDQGRELTTKLYQHPLINGLFNGVYDPAQVKGTGTDGMYKRMNTLPSYIPARNFALALLDTVTGATADGRAPPPLSVESLRDACSKVGNETVRRALLISVDAAQGDLSKAQTNVETWFDNGMERVSGRYRRRSQGFILWTSVVLVVGLNVNTLTIVERLSVDSSLRQALVERANDAGHPAATGQVSGDKALELLGEMRLPIGWNDDWRDVIAQTKDQGMAAPAKGASTGSAWLALIWTHVAHPLLGWLLTVLAVSMGAPFWFDALNRLTDFRATFKPKTAAAATAASPTVVEIRTAPAAATPVPHPFQPREWESGSPQEGVP